MKALKLGPSMVVVVILSSLLLCGQASAVEAEKYEVESVEASLSSPQAGAHADLTVAFALSEENNAPYALTKDITVKLPPGVIGNPQGIPRCSPLQFGGNVEESDCPVDSQVGSTEVDLGGANAGRLVEPVYNVDPPSSSVVARLGFFAGPYPTMIDITVNPVNYSLVATIEGISAGAYLVSARTTLWGVPAAAVHDPLRITPEEAENSAVSGGRESNLPPVPFMTNPTDCGTVRMVSVTATSYQLPSRPSSRSAPFPSVVGCPKLGFAPQLTVLPTSTEAAAATGIDAVLQIPQDETPQGRATSELKSASVLLPPGLTINPSAGDGLEACSVEQVGFERDEDAHCPNGSKIGTAEIEVPALEHVLQGSVYQRTPEPGNLFRFWLVADELGVHLKLPAEIKANPANGQLTTIFGGLASLGGNPQVPVASLKLHIFGGPRAPLSTPVACGTYQTNYSLTPWSGNSPATGSTPTQITSGCSKGGFLPKITAGTLNPSGGKYSPFVFELTRQDGEANPSTISVQLPEGLLANLGSVPLCGETAAAGNCEPNSQVGVVSVAAGVGSTPLWIPQTGKPPTAVYLAGPYKGAPYSLVIKVPAQAGPFDLGTVVTRAAIQVDPMATQATISADPLPQILEGVPVTYRNIYVSVNRANFTINPTNCNAMQVNASVVASNGAAADPSAGFQATNCARLAFEPELSISLRGQTKRTGHPALKAVLTYPKKGEFANIARAQVNLPHSEFIDQGNLDKTCTRPVLLAGNCPARSIYGKAKAWSPLLSKPLEGPVYLVGGYGYKLPALVAELNGQIRVLLVGKVDTGPNHGIRNTFEAVPDAPIEKFELQLRGGKKYSLLENSENLCTEPQRAIARFTAQNGKVLQAKPTVAVKCPKKKSRSERLRGPVRADARARPVVPRGQALGRCRSPRGGTPWGLRRLSRAEATPARTGSWRSR